MISFDSLAVYEAYRGRLRGDPAAMTNVRMAQAQRFILEEKRTFLAPVAPAATPDSLLRALR